MTSEKSAIFPKFALKRIFFVTIETRTALHKVLRGIDLEYDGPHFLKVSSILAGYFEFYRPKGHTRLFRDLSSIIKRN